MWKLVSLAIGLAFGGYLWMTGQFWNSGLVYFIIIAAALVLIPLFWYLIELLVVVALFIGFL